MEYGTKIDEYDPTKEVVYNLITEYYDNPKLTKIKDIDNFSIYMAKIDYLLYNEHRYIIAFMIKNNFQIGTLVDLDDIKWHSFQTRSITDDHKIMTFQHIPKKLSKFQLRIELTSRDEKQSVYKCINLPNITLTLLHKGNSKYEFTDKGTLISALETWRTIITFN